MIRNYRLAIGGALMLLAQTANAATDTPMATVTQFIVGFNAGDNAMIAASHTADVAIIDEFAPHVWSGIGSFEAWGRAFAADAKTKGLTIPKVVIGQPIVSTSTGTNAYIVVPAVYTYRQKAVAMREPATMSYALIKTADGWRVSAWSWNGTVPSLAIRK